MSSTNNTTKSFEEDFIAGFIKARKSTKSFEEKFLEGYVMGKALAK